MLEDMLDRLGPGGIDEGAACSPTCSEQGQSSASRTSTATCSRDSAPVLARMLVTCDFTVATDMKSVPAMSAFDAPPPMARGDLTLAGREGLKRRRAVARAAEPPGFRAR